MQILNLLIVSRTKNYHTDIKIDNNYNFNNNSNNFKFNYNYTKIVIKDPFTNRDIIARIAKKQKGVYV